MILHRRRCSVRGAALMVSIGLFVVLTSCSSGSDESAANYVSVEGAVPATAATTSAADAATVGVDSDSPPADDFDQITQVFDSFLAKRAQVITGDLALTELESVATPAAIEQVLALRTENEAKIARDSYAALSDLAEWSNVTTISQVEDRLFFTDCTERQHVTPGGATVVTFVTNNVAVLEQDGSYRVDQVVVAQDGIVLATPTEFGCVPPSFLERAETTARTAVEAVEDLIADPQAALAGELPPVFADDARRDLLRVLETLVDQGHSRQADELVTYTVLGMDVHRPEFTVVVSVCRSYPNGRSFIDASGNLTISDIATGASVEEWVYVNLEPAPPGSPTTDVASAVQDRAINCQEG